MSTHDEHHHDHGSVQFEPTDVPSRPVVISVISLATFTIVFTAAAHFFFKMLEARHEAEAVATPTSPLAERYGAKEPPLPRLQTEPRTDLEKMWADEDRILNNYAWVDKDGGVVQVPITRAMEMLLAQGLPAREGAVPLKMQPKGTAPGQMKEGAGAPDWIGQPEGGHSEESGLHSGASAEPAPGKHGH